MFTVKSRHLLCGLMSLILLIGRLSAQAVANPYEGEDEDPFFGNPHEATERAERDEAYLREWEADGGARDVLDELLAPRLYGEVFDTQLPGVDFDGSWRLRLNPKGSDLFGEDYIRWPIGVRYQFNTHLEGQFDLGLYTANPFESGSGSGYYDIEPGFKYTLRKIFATDWNMALGITSQIPIADPPLEVIDGFARYRPYVSFSRALQSSPALMFYFSVKYELVAETPFTANPVIPQPKDRVFFIPGLIYYPGGHFRYGLEFEYRTNAISFSEEEPRPADYMGPQSVEDVRAFETTHEYFALPSVTWFPNRKTRAGLRIPGNWDVSLRLEIPIVEETGEDFGLSVRFNWYYNYRKLINRDLRRFFQRDEQED